MQKEASILVIDAGNTSTKVGRYQQDTLIEVYRFENKDRKKLIDFLDENSQDKRVLASVLSEKATQEILNQGEVLHIDSNTPSNLKIEYGSLNTLGIDRLCNAVATVAKTKTEFGLCVDIGTCIKFDIVNLEGRYMGGSIGPGIDLRFKALNDYTGKLPLLSNKNALDLVGTDTKTSIRSGVINGMNAEINGLIEAYRKQFTPLTIFVTGGDARYFDIDSKNDIFADENLTLHGLFEIYKHNA